MFINNEVVKCFSIILLTFTVDPAIDCPTDRKTVTQKLYEMVCDMKQKLDNMSKQNNEENDWDDDWSFDKLKNKKELDWSEQQLAKKRRELAQRSGKKLFYLRFYIIIKTLNQGFILFKLSIARKKLLSDKE